MATKKDKFIVSFNSDTSSDEESSDDESGPDDIKIANKNVNKKGESQTTKIQDTDNNNIKQINGISNEIGDIAQKVSVNINETCTDKNATPMVNEATKDENKSVNEAINVTANCQEPLTSSSNDKLPQDNVNGELSMETDSSQSSITNDNNATPCITDSTDSINVNTETPSISDKGDESSQSGNAGDKNSPVPRNVNEESMSTSLEGSHETVTYTQVQSTTTTQCTHSYQQQQETFDNNMDTETGAKVDIIKEGVGDCENEVKVGEVGGSGAGADLEQDTGEHVVEKTVVDSESGVVKMGDNSSENINDDIITPGVEKTEDTVVNGLDTPENITEKELNTGADIKEKELNTGVDITDSGENKEENVSENKVETNDEKASENIDSVNKDALADDKDNIESDQNKQRDVSKLQSESELGTDDSNFEVKRSRRFESDFENDTHFVKEIQDSTDDLIARILAEARGEPVPPRKSTASDNAVGAASGTSYSSRYQKDEYSESRVARRFQDDDSLDGSEAASGSYRGKYSWRHKQRAIDDDDLSFDGNYFPPRSARRAYQYSADHDGEDDGDDVFRRRQAPVEYIPDEEFVPTKSENTETVVKEKSAEIRNVVDKQDKVLKMLRKSSDSFDELTSEIKTLRQNFIESTMRRSMMLDELEQDKYEQEQDERRARAESDARRANSGRSTYKYGRSNTTSAINDYSSEYGESSSPVFKRRANRYDVDDGLDDEPFARLKPKPFEFDDDFNIIRKPQKKPLDLDNDADDDLLGKGALGNLATRSKENFDFDYRDMNLGTRGLDLSARSSRSTYDEPSRPRRPTYDDYDYEEEDRSRYAPKSTYAQQIAKKYGRSRSLYEDESNTGSYRSPKSYTFANKYGVNMDDEALNGDDTISLGESEGSGGYQPKSYTSSSLSKYGVSSLGKSKYGSSSRYSSNDYSSTASSRYGTGTRSSSVSRLGSVGRASTLSDYSFDRPSFRDRASAEPETTSRFLQKVRERKVTGESEPAKRDKPFKSRFLGKSFDTTSDYSSSKTSYSASSRSEKTTSAASSESTAANDTTATNDTPES